MSRELLLKVVIGLASAFAGWVLAQLTATLRTWLSRRKVHTLLIEELMDLDAEINRLYYFYARQLEVYGANCISSESMAGLTNPVYQNYYKDVVLHLNQKQRLSFQLIHSLVDFTNEGLAQLREKSKAAYQSHAQGGVTEEFAKLAKSWGEAVRAQFQSCAGLQWQIRFHLEHRNGPDLRPNTADHERFLMYLESVKCKASEYIADGKTIEPSKFNQLYDPASFQKDSP